MPKIFKIKRGEIILGIDPGLANTGYALIKKIKDNLTLLVYGVITTKAHLPIEKRLEKISKGLEKIIKKYQPQIIAIEELFFCKNVKTALKVGQAQGVILLTAQKRKLRIYNFTPLQVKQAVTNYGRAEKKQVQMMVKNILKLKKIPQPDDAADAIAIAICCANSLT